MAIENNKTQVQFQLSANRDKLGTPAAGTIVFIQESKELYLDGTYYGLSTDAAKTLSDAVANIGTLTEGVSGLVDVTTNLTTYVANLRKFADGAAANSTEGPVLSTREGILKGKTNVKAAIDALADVVDRLNVKQWTAVTKPGDAGQFATSVEQKTDGSITVSYADVKSTDVKRTTEQQASIAGATVEAALETLKGAAATAQAKADKNASDITVIKGTGDGSISKAVSDAKESLIGTGEGVWAADEVKTLTKLRDLIKANAEKISLLQGVDEGTADKLKAIIKELQDAGSNGDFAGTLLDKFLTLYGTPNNGEYTANGGKHTTLQEIINAIETRITNVNNTLSDNLTSTIQGLNATVRGQLGTNDALEAGKHVGVKVDEANGILTGVTVVENDIASAQALTNLKQEVSNIKNTVEGQGSQLTWKVIS